MILTDQVENHAILSDVTSTNGFTIKTSAHAFKILSSSLYANKIRAIIRELSTNAYDSHVAAGRGDMPFDVHLPSAFEPHFAIRDYGVGLSKHEVEHIYTTYFSSTKSDSNDYVGALGLGSKSPFAYTENFSVTAIKDGIKLNYSAYVNEHGFPAIALLGESFTEEPSGVEIRFSVSDTDFYRFLDEAKYVYQWFKIHPTVSSSLHYTCNQIEYLDQDIIPGVHLMKNSYYHNSVAVMGNIAYPIEVPNQEENLGTLASLLKCNLVMHFEIGSLDFQASREGLSYIPSTIKAICERLSMLNDKLYEVFFEQATKLDNLWQRAAFIAERSRQKLWSASCAKYVAETKFELIQASYSNVFNIGCIHVSTKSIAEKFNISLQNFTCEGSRIRSNNSYAKLEPVTNLMVDVFDLSVYSSTLFLKRNTKHAVKDQIRYNCVQKFFADFRYFWVMEAADHTKEAKFDEFLAYIHNPPHVKFTSEIARKPSAKKESNADSKGVTVLSLNEDGTWSREGTVAELDAESNQQTRYYVNLSGFRVVSDYDTPCAKEIYYYMQRSGIKCITGIKVYGVRKGDAKTVEGLSNWINLEEYLKNTLTNLTEDDILNIVYAHTVFPSWVNRIMIPVSKEFSDVNTNILTKTCNALSNTKTDSVSYSEPCLNALMRIYANKKNAATAASAKVEKMISDVAERYPLLPIINTGLINTLTTLVEYINLIDNKEK